MYDMYVRTSRIQTLATEPRVFNVASAWATRRPVQLSLVCPPSRFRYRSVHMIFLSALTTKEFMKKRGKNDHLHCASPKN